MNKLMAFFVFTFIAGSMIGFIMEGGSGVATTTLTQPLLKADTTAYVVSSSGFLTGGDRLSIAKEEFRYSGIQKTGTLMGKACPCLTGLDRGVEDSQGSSTDAEDHRGPDLTKVPPRKGAKVFNRGSTVVNQVIGFNLAESMSAAGAIGTAVTLPLNIAKTAVKLVAWDFAFLEGNYAYFKYIFLYPVSAGFVYTILIVMANLFQGIFKR